MSENLGNMPVILGMLSISLGQFVVLLPDMLTKMSNEKSLGGWVGSVGMLGTSKLSLSGLTFVPCLLLLNWELTGKISKVGKSMYSLN